MMSSNQHKWHRKRPADSEDIVDTDEGESKLTLDKPEDFKIKTLDEILQEKRRRIDKDDTPGEERNGSSEELVSPVDSARHESRTSSKQGSPAHQGSEIIYQLSPEQLSLSPTSSSETQKKVRPLLPHDDGPAGVRAKKGRKKTEEEEGEIISDPSDSENRRSEKRSRRYSSISNPDIEENPKPVESKEKDDTVTKKSEESSEEESEDDSETAMATKRLRKETKETDAAKQESSESDSESGSEESSDEEEEGDAQKESKMKMKQQKESGSKELLAKNNDDDDDDDESSSEEEESSEEESESDSSEESEEKEVKKEVPQKTKEVIESTKPEEFESEDLHMELQQLKRQRPSDEKHKQKVKTERHHREERVHRRREQSSLDTRSDKERQTSEHEKEKTHLKYQRVVERRHSQSKHKSRSYEKGRSEDVVHEPVDRKDRSDKHKLYAKESSKDKSERPGTREKHSEMDIDRDHKSSRKESGKHIKSSADESAKIETTGKDRTDHGVNKRRTSASEKTTKESRGGEEGTWPSKPKKEEGKSVILTERERRQFTNEVVDIESEGSSEEDEKDAPHPDAEMKLSDGEQEGNEKGKKAKLATYYPAVRGCRNVEEFQWLNRIEEGTYGVVYRAKDRRTGDIVALKKLKMEREKEGFPITSLREINTLLKAQHPNIVTVREIVVGSNMDKIYIVMDYVEHDLKVLMEHMTQGFRIGEIKTLMIQLLRAVVHLHDNWILHRDLKASNLLLSNKGILKVGDFGLAREYGSPLKNYTPIVVTLWYRAPELLLGTKEYSTPIDLWSVGCIFAELLTMKPLFPGKSEIDQINRIFKELGTPSDKIWPGPPSYSELPAVKKMTFTDYPYNNLRNKFGAHLTDKGFDLLNRFLTYDPEKRIAGDEALKHDYFAESPQPVDPSMFPTWPAKSEMAKRPKKKDVEHSPQAPQGGAMFAKLADEGDSGNGSQGFRMPTSKKGSAAVVGFTLKF